MRKLIEILTLLLLFTACTESGREEPIVQTVVIGGGLMGSSTAWHLSKQGNSALLLEKQDSVYTQGSSYGEARIARSSNRGNDIWSYLHNNSVQETHDLINFLNSTTTSQKYSMDDIYTTLPVTYVGRSRIYDKLLASLIRQEVDYTMATNPEEGKAMFDVVLPDSVLIQREFNKYSGTVNPHKLITYLHQAISAKGNTVRYNTQVLDIVYNNGRDLYEVTTQSEKTGETKVILAEKVVSAAGPYTGELLKDIAPYFDTLINPQRVFLAFLKINAEKYASLTEAEKEKLKAFYPVINSAEGTRQGSFFSMIEYLDQDGIPVIKIGGHFQRTDIDDLDNIWDKALSASEIEWSLANTAQYFKLLSLPIEQADLEFVNGYSCVYSLTSSEVPFVTPIVNQDQSANDRLVVLGGMSGVGAKGAMTYGLIAANILNQQMVNDSLYKVVKQELGFERLISDLKE